MNPWIRYRPRNSKQLVPGVSVNLKGFLSRLDAAKISHPPESAIRHQLRRSQRNQTRSHQRFLEPSFQQTTNVKEIPKHQLNHQMACVCVPRDEVPGSFFASLLAGGIAVKVLLLAVLTIGNILLN